VGRLGVTTLMTNYLADRGLMGGAFGGAMVVAGDGTVVDSLPLAQVGTLLVDLPSATTGAFALSLDQLQPSQLYISAAKLSKVVGASNREPVPVRRLGNEIVLTDGHTRAVAAHLDGLDRILVHWDQDDLDWEAYKICVEWCHQEGIRTIADLKDRVLATAEYEELWLERCAAMHRDLEVRRSRE
jgi:hypothetical protein